MKKKYKEYTIVDNKGLKSELENAYLTCNEDLYEFFEQNKLFVVNKKMRIEETDFDFIKNKTFSEFVEKNKVLKNVAYEYIHIIEVYGPMALVECSSDFGDKTFIDRIEVDDIVKMVYNKTLYVKNPTKLKGYIGFKKSEN